MEGFAAVVWRWSTRLKLFLSLPRPLCLFFFSLYPLAFAWNFNCLKANKSLILTVWRDSLPNGVSCGKMFSSRPRPISHAYWKAVVSSERDFKLQVIRSITYLFGKANFSFFGRQTKAIDCEQTLRYPNACRTQRLGNLFRNPNFLSKVHRTPP